MRPLSRRHSTPAIKEAASITKAPKLPAVGIRNSETEGRHLVHASNWARRPLREQWAHHFRITLFAVWECICGGNTFSRCRSRPAIKAPTTTTNPAARLCVRERPPTAWLAEGVFEGMETETEEVGVEACRETRKERCFQGREIQRNGRKKRIRGEAAEDARSRGRFGGRNEVVAVRWVLRGNERTIEAVHGVARCSQNSRIEGEFG
jgi:hypothetical protein